MLSKIAEVVFGFLDDVLDRVVIIAALVITLCGFYFISDTGYIYYHADAGRIRSHQQEQDVVEIMRELSADAVAWLTVEDSSIDYPVMQAGDNAKYLNTDPYGDYSLSGSIFLDSRNASRFEDYYSILYGHHMSNGMMFGALDKFENKTYFDAHRAGTLTINGKEYALNIFAFAISQESDQEIFDPEYANNMDAYISEHASIYYPKGSGNILLLSTCRDEGAANRTLVFAEIVDYDGRPNHTEQKLMTLETVVE